MRSRNLKPSFFTNDVLAEVPPLGRLLFEGLWCVADRAGRLVERQRKLKAEILPYDDCDIEHMLCMLAERGFIVRYEVDGERYIQVVNFTKHQNPHVKEAPSSIPAPDKPGASTVQAPDKHSASTVQASEIPERARLIPDSLLLIPGSVPDGTGGKPPPEETENPAPENPKPMAPEEIIFGYGVPVLVAGGSTDKAARSFLGGLRKHHGDTAVVDAIRRCLQEKPLQPTEWMGAALPPGGHARAGPRRVPAPENFDLIDYGTGGRL